MEYHVPQTPYQYLSIPKLYPLPDIEIDQVAHGDVNRDVKTAGRVTIGNLIVGKLMTTAGSDTWLHDWLYSCQDHIVGGG